MAGTTLIFDTFLAPAWYKTYMYIVEYIERTLGIPTFLINGETLEDFSLAYADAGFVSTLSMLRLLQQQPCMVDVIAAPAFKGVDETAFFDVVVRRESSLQTLQDLERCTWADHTGQYRPALGTALIDCQEIAITSSQAQSLRLLLDGKVDATTLHSQMLEVVLNNSPHIAEQMRSIGSYRYTTGPLVVVGRHVPAAIRQGIQMALVNLTQDAFFAERLKEGQLEGFVPVTNAYFQPRHRLTTKLSAFELFETEERLSLLNRR
ncbi:phosphate/phosphite/phosphonate ABC transporter substrate-binding protein [Tengunoibacter tsumagoiensis]|uniref:Phosphate ABC transporter substrate-binding protein n=1 Tax=Tengunoibacter tsumagoiensis TaxID=2014871 RepID=A0A401ZVW7_9CHLR|nr:PhnD/SsuA/transferrin family substrate-binding protein [Tengunoibacter tsumagoiensis]GCE10987.1 hypothetical protein KTT_08460 [Tengunoibacter tsumagoiensis]